jgi:hypothetical protein
MRRFLSFAAAAVAGGLILIRSAQADPVWAGYAGDAQHTALSSVASQSLDTIHWQTPVDLDPQFSGNDLLIHYGSPAITSSNTVIVPVKTGADGGFQLSAFNGATGAPSWTLQTDYILPPHNWVPSYAPTLTPTQQLYYAGAGGTLYSIANGNAVSPGAVTQTAFYGTASYNANAAAFNSSVYINTPLTSDSAGNVYFGYTVTGANPLGLQSGIARVSANGTATYMPASAVAGNTGISQVVQNCAPAISKDGSTVYVAVSNGTNGYLVSLNSGTLAMQSKVSLVDPSNGSAAWLANDGTASPTVGPDGDVYMGTLESNFGSNHGRGFLLHFSADLSTTKAPGAFGWDDTASVVPASMVRSYHGSSSYLLMTKYNDYASAGGTGINKIAILDPNQVQTDPVSGAQVMAEVMSIAGPTPDAEFLSTHPDAVREWCINSAVVDPATDSILANSEDGKLYRWNLATNTFTQAFTLTSGVGEAYTPTMIGADGTVYAINDATLFAVGAVPEPGLMGVLAIGLGVAIRRSRGMKASRSPSQHASD